MSHDCQIAIIGATGMMGEALLDKLSERGFPVRCIHALATKKSIGKMVNYGERAISVQDVSTCDFKAIDLVIFATNTQVTESYFARVHQAGCAVIDLSAFSLGSKGAPLVIPDINAPALEGFTNKRVVCSPCIDSRLVTLLKVLHQVAVLDRVHMTVCRPASSQGRTAVEALARQSANLLNARPLELTGDMLQTAFNIFPVVKTAADDGDTCCDMRMNQDLKRLMAIPDLWLTSTLVQTPVFFGESVILQIETRRSIDFENLNDMLGSIPGISYSEDRAMPTPVSHASGTEGAYLRVLHYDKENPNEMHLWLTSDKVRNVALNSVQIAEILIKSYI